MCTVMLSCLSFACGKANMAVFCHTTAVVVSTSWIRQGVHVQDASPWGVLLGRRREDEYNPLNCGKQKRKKEMLIRNESKWRCA